MNERAAASRVLRRFKPYPEYKDSGVEWLGEIPAHWEVKPLKRALRSGNADGSLIKGRMDQEPGEGLFPGFSASGQDIWVEKAQHHEPGIVLSAVGARCGKTFKADGDWTAVANTHVIFPHGGFDRDFLWYLTNDETFWDRGGTAQPFVRVTSTLQHPWCFPSLPEQRAIGAFLDRETARIDALVAKKERLIELLQEQRTALITRAVTKGLDPTVSMKDSGVEWLGQIPAHWEVKPLKYFLRAPLAYGVLKPDKYTGENGVRLIRILDVASGQVSEEALELISPEQSEEFRRTVVRKGELVISVVGTIGRAFIVPPSLAGANLSRALARVQLKVILDARFVEYGFLATPFQSFVELIPAGTAQRVLNLGDLAEYLMAAPAPPEQRAIAAFLDRETARIDALVAKVREAIGRLKEYRTALISAAVTGKIDVREEAA